VPGRIRFGYGRVDRRELPTASAARRVGGVRPAVFLNRSYQFSTILRVHDGRRLKLPLYIARVLVDADHAEPVIVRRFWVIAAVVVHDIACREIDRCSIGSRRIPHPGAEHGIGRRAATTHSEKVEVLVFLASGEIDGDDLPIPYISLVVEDQRRGMELRPKVGDGMKG
jgi:hypothetical protein